MPGFVKTLVMILIACGACLPPIAPTAYAAQAAPIGAWLTTNECFLAAFVLTEGGRAQAAYLSGEQDDDAAWTWDGSTLRMTSTTFPLDRFVGRLTNDHVEAEYVWHDLDKDELNRQTCVFERFTPLGLQAARLLCAPGRYWVSSNSC